MISSFHKSQSVAIFKDKEIQIREERREERIRGKIMEEKESEEISE